MCDTHRLVVLVLKCFHVEDGDTVDGHVVGVAAVELDEGKEDVRGGTVMTVRGTVRTVRDFLRPSRAIAVARGGSVARRRSSSRSSTCSVVRSMVPLLVSNVPEKRRTPQYFVNENAAHSTVYQGISGYVVVGSSWYTQ